MSGMALVSDKKSVYNKVEARKTILEIGLYLSVLDATCVAINTINSIGFSAYYIIVNNFKHKIANKHSLNIRKFLSEHSDHLYIYNLNNYHDIHKKRRPDAITLSTAKHMAT
ncbi:hypothetical protein RhiirA5_407716 [Rhizophagus irregularis]|uniref:Uncharacterized protein n=1 Tax=Rhizophagus irregularis TaxID=588596 RepID=A0A2N0SDN4_9GLOM|nr:hypothetical protein RhiirA5_407716 [Rhizophagus irregularis]PKC73647.1 hypothetical protein RhiirA1_450962 [Rhizophagus irregularis]